MFYFVKCFVITNKISQVLRKIAFVVQKLMFEGENEKNIEIFVNSSVVMCKVYSKF